MMMRRYGAAAACWRMYKVTTLGLCFLVTFSNLIKDAVTSTTLVTNETVSRQIPSSSTGGGGGGGGGKSSGRLEKCENDTLKECWDQLPPFPDQGIPSSPAGVTAACKSFDIGMNCVHAWTKRCLGEEARQKIMDSVRGARETFTFLCRDPKFRTEFLQHSSCYKKISTYWDECANRFINTLKALNPAHYENMTNLCCIRRSYMRCVSQVSYFHCETSAAQFLQKMAETLVRTTLRGNAPQAQHCDNVAIVSECERRSHSAAASRMSQPLQTQLQQLVSLSLISSLFLHRRLFLHHSH